MLDCWYLASGSIQESTPCQFIVFIHQNSVHFVQKAYIANLLGALGPSLVEAEPDDSEVLAVKDELGGIKLQLLVGTQNLLLPLSIVH
jgi:hypothetical protein